MNTQIYSFLEPNLSKIKNISFCKYLQNEPQIKNEIYI